MSNSNLLVDFCLPPFLSALFNLGPIVGVIFNLLSGASHLSRPVDKFVVYTLTIIIHKKKGFTLEVLPLGHIFFSGCMFFRVCVCVCNRRHLPVVIMIAAAVVDYCLRRRGQVEVGGRRITSLRVLRVVVGNRLFTRLLLMMRNISRI